MFQNYFRMAWRNLRLKRSHGAINIFGLATGMAIALLIGLWMKDEISFDKSNRHYRQIAQVMQNQDLNGQRITWGHVPFPVAEALRNNFKEDIKVAAIVNWATSIFSYQDKLLSRSGLYVEPQGALLLDLDMEKGKPDGLREPDALLISRSAATALFGDADPLDKIVKVENTPAKIAGVYKDMPANSSFADVRFIASWELKLKIAPGLKGMENPWGYNGFQVMLQLADNASMEKVSAKIRDVKLKNIREQEKLAHPALFLQPMADWHLYSEFKGGVNTGGRIRFVWWFGIIGAFVLLLACINFMNLSTARSEQRAKEVGIRKAVGSLRRQLIGQFLSESVLVALIAFFFALLLVQVSLPFFNTLTEKSIVLPWTSPGFWAATLGFVLFTGLLAGSYPAFYLSSFKPVRVLKGAFSPGRYSSLPRQVLVVLQFTVSAILIIGTIVIYRQIQFARNRPVGYDRQGLLSVSMHMYNIRSHFEAIRQDLLNTGAVSEIAESGSPITAVYSSNGGMIWRGKAAGTSADLAMNSVSFGYGSTVGWKILEGRDFSKDFPSDSSAFILNESAVKFMGFRQPIGEQVSFNDGVAFTVVGIVKDFIIESPYEPVRPMLFRIVRGSNGGLLNVKINPAMSAQEALPKIGAVLHRYNPDLPFDYKFADEEYARKFNDEARIGHLATVFALLAIFISCLGLFGLASFVAERRTKEIGIRRVLGASVSNIWRLLSKDFVILVLISLLIATPAAWYFMHGWLQHYTYRTDLSWWIFAVTGAGALGITLLTVSFQGIKAALTNPVKSLRTE